MKEEYYHCKIKFLMPVLGSQTSKTIASDYIAKKAGIELPEDEIESLPDALDKGTTVFHRDAQGRPILFNYQVKGFFKNSGQVQNGKTEDGTKNLKSKVRDYLFISPRQILINQTNGHEIGYNERPLPAQTPMGQRMVLARSEEVATNALIEFDIALLGGVISEGLLRELLDYGFRVGIGQWRYADYGSFCYELERLPDE